jgi:hypothetical protein
MNLQEWANDDFAKHYKGTPVDPAIIKKYREELSRDILLYIEERRRIDARTAEMSRRIFVA